MSGARKVLSAVRAAGGRLEMVGDRIDYLGPPAGLTDSLLRAMRTHADKKEGLGLSETYGQDWLGWAEAQHGGK